MRSVFVVMEYAPNYDMPSKLYGVYLEAPAARNAVNLLNAAALRKAETAYPTLELAKRYAHTHDVIELPLDDVLDYGVEV